MIKPTFLLVEPTNRCNLKCPLCPAGMGKNPRKAEQLEPWQLEVILKDPLVRSPTVLLWGWGEPTLNEKLPALVRVAHNHGCFVEIQSNGHGETVIYNVLLEEEVDRLTIALDDLDNDRIKNLRGPNASALQVMNLITYLGEHATRTELVIQTLVTRHNEDILEDIYNWGKGRGATVIFKTLNPGDAPTEFANRLLPTIPELQRNSMPPEGPCSFLESGGTMLCDGTFVPCCYDWEGQYPLGSLQDGWSAIHRNRGLFREKMMHGEIVMCQNCTHGSSLYLDEELLGFPT